MCDVAPVAFFYFLLLDYPSALCARFFLLNLATSTRTFASYSHDSPTREQVARCETIFTVGHVLTRQVASAVATEGASSAHVLGSGTPYAATHDKRPFTNSAGFAM